MNMVVRRDFCATDCGRLADWVNSPEGAIPGVGRFRLASADATKQFTYVASLGIATPESINGVTRVSAEQVAELGKQGVAIVDTRSAKEYESEHIRGAVLASYVEKSLKEIDFDGKKDDFSALKTFAKDKPIVFLCNGPECWKSFKASRTALAEGYTKIYWFRGGMPEWREKHLPVEGTKRSGPRRQAARSGAGARPRQDGRSGALTAPRRSLRLATQVDDALGLLAVEPEAAADAVAVGIDRAAQRSGVDRVAAFRRIDVHRDEDAARPGGASAATTSSSSPRIRPSPR
jgi:rhodanese-related sulfurtransferase